MWTPKVIGWEESWRREYPLAVPLRTWVRAWGILFAPNGRPVLLAAIPCALILWIARGYLTTEEWSRVLRLFAVAFVMLLFGGPVGCHSLAILFQCIFTFCPPFAEVSRKGVRVSGRFFPYAEIQVIEVAEENGRTWLRFTSGRDQRKSEIPPTVDLAALRDLLAVRDKGAARPSRDGCKYESPARVFGAVLAGFACVLVLLWALSFVFDKVVSPFVDPPARGRAEPV